MLQSDWETWLEEAEICPTEISVTDTEVIFEIDEAQFVIKTPDDEQDMPWRFEIVNQGEMTEKRETWLNDVNDDFQGKERTDPPKGFFEIMA